MKVFIIDGHPGVRQRLAALAADAGAAVVGEADDAQIAADLAPVFAPDLILVDVRLRGGLGLLESLRAISPRPLVLVLTTPAPVELRARCRAAGADLVIDKAANCRSVLRVLRELRAETRAAA